MKHEFNRYPKIKMALLGYCLLFSFLIIVSCKKSLKVVLPQSAILEMREGDVYEKNGRLVIRDRTTYYDILASFQGENDSLLDLWEMNLGFSSMRKYFEDNGEQDSIECPIEDDYFATLLNTDGIIQIGTRIYKIDVEDEKVFIIPDSDERKVPYLLYNQAIEDTILAVGMSSDSAWYITFSGYLSENYDGYFDDSDDEHTALGPCLEFPASTYADVAKINYTNNGSHYRIKYRLEYKTYGIYNFLITKLKHQKRNALFVWNNYQTTLEIRANARWKKRCHPEQCKSGEVIGPLYVDEIQWLVWWSPTKKLHAYFLIETLGYRPIGNPAMSFITPNEIYCNYCTSACNSGECLYCL